MTVTSEYLFRQALAYRDENDYPFDAQGQRLPLQYDHEFEWTTEPNDYTCSGSVYRLSYNRGAY